jgi:hypothetical protein
MTLINNIKLINGGGIFQAYAEDAILLNGRVIKNEQDVGLNEHQYNYFYTRHDDKPIIIRSAERPMSSNTPYEIASPKVLVLQFKEYDLNGIMYAALNVFNGNYNRLRYEVNQVEIRKEIILKSEIGEVRPMDGYRLIKISYTEYMPLDSCEEITCNGDVVIPLTNDVKVYINDVLRYEPSCNTNLELTLVDDLGNPINATYNGTEIVVALSCADARVSNSDDSYDVNVASGGDLELPDENITLNGGAFLTKPSVKDQDIELVDTADAPITPDSVVGNKIVVDTSAGCSTKGLMPLQSGQTTSYATNDDGDLQRGRLVDFNTLPYNNGFGNTFRFTDELGNQTFTNNIVIDWSTWDGGSDVLGFCASINSDTSGSNDWYGWMSGQPYSASGFNNFYVANANELNSVINFNLIDGFVGYPFNFDSNSTYRMYTSTTFSNVTTNAMIKMNSSPNLTTTSKTTGSRRAFLVRTFTWNGASLT